MRTEFASHNAQVVTNAFGYDPMKSKIDLLLTGKSVDSEPIAAPRRKLPQYGYAEGIDLAQIREHVFQARGYRLISTIRICKGA